MHRETRHANKQGRISLERNFVLDKGLEFLVLQVPLSALGNGFSMQSKIVF